MGGFTHARAGYIGIITASTCNCARNRLEGGRVAVVNLTVQGFQLDGINAANSARDVYLAGLICRGNGRSGITVGGASQVEIDVSLLGNNGRAQLLTLPYSETAIRNTDLLSNTAPAWVDRGGRVYLGGQRIEGGIDGRDVRAEEALKQP